jgi:hypothetical protein
MLKEAGSRMRPRLENLIPILLLAVLVQLFAPIAAFRAVAYAANDPLYMASICTGMTSATDVPATPPGTAHSHGDCAFCPGSHGGGANALDPPRPLFVSLQRSYQLISWLEAADPVAAIRAGSNTQARAPPLLT